mmetsp:Transcript_29632/g.41700  ORF Transcript_29632/g.41700 Transcript_29632/m.41700 type:complete len:314 (-) Transcript_29632:68-1009(-)
MFGNFLAPFFQGIPNAALPQTFQKNYRCYSPAMLTSSINVEGGGKIILPASALDQLAQLQIAYPMLFELSNAQNQNKRTHCGVLEFTADEGCCNIPYWMMQLIGVEEGGFVSVKSVNLPKGTYVKLQPHTTSFIELANPKAILERQLRNFACLTLGDVIAIEYNKKYYHLSVVELKPAKAVTILETDIQLDFAPPLDYVEKTPTSNAMNIPMSQSPKASSFVGSNPSPSNVPQVKKQKLEDTHESDSDDNSDQKFKPFTGQGFTLSGKGTPPPKHSVKKEDSESESESDDDTTNNNNKFKAFSGTGYSLKGNK